jgi:glucose/arabinose dehydrogenase
VTRRDVAAWSVAIATIVAFAACSGGGGAPGPAPSGTAPSPASTHTAAATATPTPSPTHSGAATATPTPSITATATATPTPSASQLPGLNVRLTLPNGFYGNAIASITAPRGLAFLPNGDLLVGTTATRNASVPVSQPCSPTCSSTIYIVPQADGPLAAGAPAPFVTVPDAEAQGVAYSPTSGKIYIATTFGVWDVPYHYGDQSEPASALTQIVHVRTGPITDAVNDGDIHANTSVAVVGSNLYIGVGSSCNRCQEADPTRAVVLRTSLSGTNQVTIAKNFRNPLALTVNPQTGTVWGGGAGQDCLSVSSGLYATQFPTKCGSQDNAYLTGGHPYEFMDHISTSAAASSNGTADYGWPYCEEDHISYGSSTPCTNVEPAVEAQAYSTIMGATFYPSSTSGSYAFPTHYGGGMFMAFHGSWHENANGINVSPPNVVFVPMSGDTPVTPVNWAAPDAQWSGSVFLSSYQDNEGNRYGQPTGLAVGPQGSLFVADDCGNCSSTFYTGNAIYRIRPGTPPTGAAHARRSVR